MTTVTLSTVYDTLKTTLNVVVDDETKGYESKCDFKKWMDELNMDDYWEEDLEMGGPGLASEVGEAVEIPTGTIREGAVYRYTARKFGLKLVISEEAIEDNKYKEAINLAGRNTRALWKTADIDATNIMVRATDSNYVGGDGVVMASASHTLPDGGTFSNLMSTAMSPSVAAVSIATSAVRKMVGHDGVTEGYEIEKVVFPTEQWRQWDELVLSDKAPDMGNYSRINVVKRLNITPVPLKHWGNTTTNFCFITDAPQKPNFRWRKKPSTRSWMENGNQVMFYSISARWDNGYSDPRAFYFSNA